MSELIPVRSSPNGDIVIYQTQDGRTRLQVEFEGETVWLTQAQMAELFQTSVPNINIHLRNLFAKGELQQESAIKQSLITAADNKQYSTRLYNLDVIFGCLGLEQRRRIIERRKLLQRTPCSEHRDRQ